MKNNYLVFGYDATGNGESKSKITGLPQQLIDLHYTINFINTNINDNLPLLLFGHSWGGYAVCNILNVFPNIKGIVSIAGFNKSTDMIYEPGVKYVNILRKFLLNFVYKHEKKLFGEYSKYTGINGLKNSKCKAMIIHSEDDQTVPIEYGYNVYYDIFKNDNRFIFVNYQDKGHSTVFYSYEAIDRLKNSKNEKLFNLIDKELFEDIVDFYNESIQFYKKLIYFLKIL